MELSQTDLENFWTSILGAEESWCFCEEWCHVFLEKEIELHWMRRKEKFIFASWGWGKNDKWSQNVAGTRKLQPSSSSIILLVKRKKQKQKHFWWVFVKTSQVKWNLLSRVRLFVTPWTIYSPQNFPGQNTGGSLSLLQGIFSTQRSNPGVPQFKFIHTCFLGCGE